MELDGAFERALALHSAGRYDEAKALYQQLLASGRRDGALLHNLGWACVKTYDPDAEVFLRQAIPLVSRPAIAQRSLAYALLQVGRFSEAEALFRSALPHLPNDETGPEALGFSLLGQGRWAEGFEGLLARRSRRTSPGPLLGIPEWRGEPLPGKSLVVLAEQGLGDQIQFARFLPMLKAARITYVGPAALQRLFSHLRVRYVVAEAGERFELEPHDFWTHPLSIPAALALSDLPSTPYLPSRQGGRGIGIAWRGNPRNPVDRARSLPPQLADQLLRLPDAISLDLEDTGARDMEETRQIIADLGLVISVDTSVAHLAGAMGKPVWVLLPKVGLDWRWMAERRDSPWYRTARLFRQQDPSDWTGVIAQVVGELHLTFNNTM